MTIGPLPQCAACSHLAVDPDKTCTAFPSGIPDDIWQNLADHRRPVDGDHGIRWESNGLDFPTWAMADRDQPRRSHAN